MKNKTLTVNDFDTIEIRIKQNEKQKECYVTWWVDNELISDEWIKTDKLYNFLNFVFIKKFLTNKK